MARSTFLIALALAAAASAGTVAFPAYAQDSGPVAEVRYSDLNLASSQGAAALKVRVERAAKRVCQATGDKTLSAATESKNCARIALARAMPQVELALANAGTQLADAGRVSVAAR